jgi:two-component system sensor histidine kinase ChvG
LLASVALVSAPVASAWLLGRYERLLIENRRQELAHIAEVIVGASAADPVTLSPDSLRELALAHHVMVRVLDREKKLVFTSGSTTGAPRAPSSNETLSDLYFGPDGPPSFVDHETSLIPEAERWEVRSAFRGKTASEWRIDHSHTLQTFYIAAPLPDGAVLYLARGQYRVFRVVQDVRWPLFNLTLPLLVAATIFGALLAWRFVSPIEEIQRSVRRYLVLGRRTPIALARKDEIGELSRDFQALADILEAQIARTARVTADLTHDLKNPITSILLAADMLTETPAAELTKGDRVERIAKAIREGGVHLQRSVQAMLDLARLEERLVKEDIRVLDLHAEAERLAAIYREDPRSRHLKINVYGESSEIRALGESIDGLLRNLLDNAAVFAKSTIQLAIEHDEQHVRLTVADDGPGVSPGNRDKIFRRFFSDRPGGGGTGLGLSIVETIARSHQADVELLERGVLEGASFRVTFPRSSSS